MFAQNSKNSSTKEVISYTYPKLHTGKEWYVDFYAWDPVLGNLRRKKIKLNHIEKITDRRKFAAGLIYRISTKLENAWNPWIEAENSLAYRTFSEVCQKYTDYLQKLFSDCNLREKTLYGYLSMLKMFKSWNQSRKVPITYIYQYDQLLISDFLEYIYLDRNNSIRTRNNYLTWLCTFDSYLMQHSYIKNSATEGISSIKKNNAKKDRQVISDKDIIRLHDYLEKENKHFLLASYILHYALIRPKEMSWLKLNNFNLAKQTIFISGTIAKNKKNAVVTLPAKVIRLMLDLEVFNNPGDYYLFSEQFRPGSERKSEKVFRDFWDRKVRKDLKFPKEYKFYSLKDTGITAMLHSCDTLTVRDQARHSSILMTNNYTPQDIQEANELLLNYEGKF